MKTLYHIVFGAALAATLALAGCENGGATANFPTLKAPNVAVSPIPDGVKLEWDTDIDATGYVVYRRQAGGEDIFLASTVPTDPETGKRYYKDLQNTTLNSVKANTTYTYTVKAYPLSALKESAATKVTVDTFETFLAEGDKLDPPEAVAIELLPNSEQIKVTVTPGAHKDLAASYSVTIYRDGDTSVGATTIAYPATTGVWAWASAQQISGTYTARVQTNPVSFYTSSEAIESEGTVFEPLFGAGFGITVGGLDIVVGINANLYTAVNYSARISMSKFRPGVTYTVERAPADKLGNATGDYAPVTLSKMPPGESYYEVMPADKMTADGLGYLGTTVFYDRTLPAEAGGYVYRVKAAKGDAIQYKPKSGAFFSIDPTGLAATYIRINVAAPTSTNVMANYAVTSSIQYKNVLPSDSKLVICWVKGGGASYQYGQYGSKIEFSKTDLETSETPKYIGAPIAVEGYVFARAYLEFADGTRKLISDTAWRGSGIYTTASYSEGGTTIYYARFNNN